MLNLPDNFLADILSGMIRTLSTFIPQFFAGLIILLIGILAAGILKTLVLGLFRVIKLEAWLEEAGLASEKDTKVWPGIIAELIKISVIFVFLVPAVEAWGLPKATDILNQFLLYLPNVFVSVFIGFVGLIAGNLVSDIVRHGFKGVGKDTALALSLLAKYAIVFFTVLVVLNQLGVASELIKILFTGIVAMFALACGLAFGLGGQDTAREILKKLKQRLDK